MQIIMWCDSDVNHAMSSHCASIKWKLLLKILTYVVSQVKGCVSDSEVNTQELCNIFTVKRHINTTSTLSLTSHAQ